MNSEPSFRTPRRTPPPAFASPSTAWVAEERLEHRGRARHQPIDGHAGQLVARIPEVPFQCPVGEQNAPIAVCCQHRGRRGVEGQAVDDRLVDVKICHEHRSAYFFAVTEVRRNGSVE